MTVIYSGITDGKLCYIEDELYYQATNYSDFSTGGGFMRIARLVRYSDISDLLSSSVTMDNGDIAYVPHGGAGDINRGMYARIDGEWHYIGAIEVTHLPPIPDYGMRDVYWISSEDNSSATGDGQIWRAYAGQDRWYPTQKFTSLSGIPVSGA